MQVARINQQVERIGQYVYAADEMCGRRVTSKKVLIGMKDLKTEYQRLKALLLQEEVDAVFASRVSYLRQTGESLRHSCKAVDHKDTRLALLRVHEEVARLEKYVRGES